VFKSAPLQLFENFLYFSYEINTKNLLVPGGGTATVPTDMVEVVVVVEVLKLEMASEYVCGNKT
jgi:hypothetical protein